MFTPGNWNLSSVNSYSDFFVFKGKEWKKRKEHHHQTDISYTMQKKSDMKVVLDE
jgi:hypothetical protein